MNRRIKLISVPVIALFFVLLLLLFEKRKNTIYIFIESLETGTEISATVRSRSSEVKISAYAAGQDNYFLFLPSYAQNKYIKIDSVGHSVESADNISFLKTEQGLTFTIDNRYTLTVLNGSSISSVFLTLKHKLSYISSDKELTDSGSALVLSSDGSTLYAGKLQSIHGRGNTSWEQDKKPFNIEFSDPAPLLGQDASPRIKYSLIASSDKSFLRNHISAQMAKTMEAFTPEHSYVNLYINNSYQGVYEVWERILPETIGIRNLEQETGALNARSGMPSQYTTGRYLEDWNHSVTGKWWNYPKNPEKIDGGYILEADQALRYGNEPSGFILDSGAYIVSKSPSYLTEAQYRYLSSYVQDCEDAMTQSVGLDDYGSLSGYIDTRSFITKYLVEEVSKNIDCSSTSQYFYKDSGGLLYAGPPWDYDWAYGVDRSYGSGQPVFDSYGNRLDNGIDFNEPAGYSARNIPGTLNWWQLLYYNNAFYADMTNMYKNTLYPWLAEAAEQYIPQWEALLSDSAVMDYIRWNQAGATDLSAVRDAYHSEVSAICDFLRERSEFLYREWAAPATATAAEQE